MLVPGSNVLTLNPDELVSIGAGLLVVVADSVNKLVHNGPVVKTSIGDLKMLVFLVNLRMNLLCLLTLRLWERPCRPTAELPQIPLPDRPITIFEASEEVAALKKVIKLLIKHKHFIV